MYKHVSSNKTLFKTVDSGPDLAHKLWFAHSCSMLYGKKKWNKGQTAELDFNPVSSLSGLCVLGKSPVKWVIRRLKEHLKLLNDQ